MIISVELVGIDGVSQRCEIAKVDRSLDGARLNNFGLSLEEAKDIQRRLQQELTQFQTDQAAQRDRKCQDCNRRRSVHDSRYRTIHSLFGSCHVRVPRWCRCACGSTARLGTGCVETLLNGRATPELERIQAELGSRLSFREAARVLDIFVPATRPHNHRTVSNRLGKVADQIEKWDVAGPYRISRAGKSPISVFIDNAYIRAVPGYQSRHSRSRWDALLRKAEHRVSLPVRRISLPANTISFAQRCARNQTNIRADQQSWHLPGAERSFDRQLLSAILVRSADIQFTGRKCRQQPRQCLYE